MTVAVTTQLFPLPSELKKKILLSSEMLLDFSQQIVEEILLQSLLSDHALRLNGSDILQRVYRLHLWLTRFYIIY